ncbi:MAG TPA: sel1 repeat family protein, partial [Myxococcota bacterium]|nr:sel1 repeat family protein [Myxococcota bacterium]
QAATFLTLACDAGDAFGCSQLGEAYFTGTGVAVDRARGMTLFERGCSGGDNWACRRRKELRVP